MDDTTEVTSVVYERISNRPIGVSWCTGIKTSDVLLTVFSVDLDEVHRRADAAPSFLSCQWP